MILNFIYYQLKITVYNDIDTKRNEYALTGVQRSIFQSTGIDQLKPVLTFGSVSTHIDRSFANLDTKKPRLPFL